MGIGVANLRLKREPTVGAMTTKWDHQAESVRRCVITGIHQTSMGDGCLGPKMSRRIPVLKPLITQMGTDRNVSLSVPIRAISGSSRLREIRWPEALRMHGADHGLWDAWESLMTRRFQDDRAVFD